MVSIDFICFSHLRWNFVFQRPQHLLSRFARNYRVFFIEEPVFNATENYMEITLDDSKLIWIMVPHIKPDMQEAEIIAALKVLLNDMFTAMQITKYILWYYSPMALGYSDHLEPELIVYDCMDELSAFKFAPPLLALREQNLLQKSRCGFYRWSIAV